LYICKIISQIFYLIQSVVYPSSAFFFKHFFALDLNIFNYPYEEIKMMHLEIKTFTGVENE